MPKDSFILYIEQEQLFEELSDAQIGRIVKAIFEYEKKQTIPKLSQIEKAVFKSFKMTLDKNREKYEKVVERNKKNIEKRWNKNNTKNTTGKFGIPKNTKNTDNDNDNDNDNDSDNEYDNDEVLSEVVKYYEDNMGLLVPSTATILIDLKEKHSKELIKEAIDICCKRNVRTMDYLEGILNKWESKGLKTLGDVKNEKRSEKINLDEVWNE